MSIDNQTIEQQFESKVIGLKEAIGDADVYEHFKNLIILFATDLQTNKSSKIDSIDIISN